MSRFAVVTTALGIVSAPGLAWACGCFAPGAASQPVVQAGERIVFATDGTTISAHIQIQYSGPAEEFAWLLPMPAVPELRLSSERLFDRLEASTRVETTVQTELCATGPVPLECVPPSPEPANNNSVSNNNMGAEPPFGAVREEAVGPFDTAVLPADDLTMMTDWLRDNGYFVPAASEDALMPYIRPGAFFLALKLRKGETVGSIRPVLVEYEADLPVIPLVLTQIGAVPNMDIVVWTLGDARGVPMNYRHITLNERNRVVRFYPSLVTQAVDQAPNGHAFVTDFAGRHGLRLSSPIPAARDELAQTQDAQMYVDLIEEADLAVETLAPLIEAALPAVRQAELDPQRPDAYWAELYDALTDYDGPFDPVGLTDAIWERFVIPVATADAMLRQHSYLTRLYTTMSPEEMTADPVFGFNPDLPEVSNRRPVQLVQQCDPIDRSRPWAFTLSDGRTYLGQTGSLFDLSASSSQVPVVATIERLGLEGPPVIEVDNRPTLDRQSAQSLINTCFFDGGGCSGSERNPVSWLVNAAVLGAFIFIGLILARSRRAQ